MADYVTTAEARAYAYQSVAGDDTVLAAILTRASRMFDLYCGLGPNYFAANGGAAASARKFWGDGTDYLKIDPHTASLTPTVAMPSGFAAPTFLLSNPNEYSRMAQNSGEFFLVRTYGDNESRFSALEDRRDYFFAEFSSQLDYIGWPVGIKATVTAKWGWDAVPDDVKEAVLETTVAIFRNRDQAFARVVNLETSQVFNDVMPPKAKMIADRYRLGKAMFV